MFNEEEKGFDYKKKYNRMNMKHFMKINGFHFYLYLKQIVYVIFTSVKLLFRKYSSFIDKFACLR